MFRLLLLPSSAKIKAQMSPQLKSNLSSWTSRTIKTYFSFNVIFIPKNEISNNVKVFLFLFYYLFYKKKYWFCRFCRFRRFHGLLIRSLVTPSLTHIRGLSNYSAFNRHLLTILSFVIQFAATLSSRVGKH